MLIRELYLKNFGKFSDQTFLIKDGIHVFYGENEFGKSTLYAFIKGMLFGMERARGRASKNDAFSQYEPWNNPNYYAGVLRFESGGRNFRLERSFDKITKSASLICEDDGEELSIEQGDLEVLLEGMSASTFENTFAIGQLRVETTQELAADLKNYAANYYESGSGTIDVQGALERLKVKQRTADAKVRQELLKKERTRSRIEQECDYVERDIQKLRADEQDVKKRLHLKRRREDEAAANEAYHSEMSEHEERRGRDDSNNRETGSGQGDAWSEWTEEELAQMRWRRRQFLPALILMLLFLTASVVLLVVTARGIGGAIARNASIILNVLTAAMMVVMIFARIRIRLRDRQATDQAGKNPGEAAGETVAGGENSEGGDASGLKGRGRNESERLSWELGRIRANLHEKNVRLGNLNEQREELEVSGYDMTPADRQSRAVRLAAQTIEKMADDIIKGFGTTLNEKASEIVSAITEGKYDKLYVDEKLNMFLLTKEKRVSVSMLSRGTIEQIYFALRMAAIDILYEETFPIILDDTFVFYDDARLESVLRWLRNQNRQVILFTCQKRETEILNRLESE